MAVEDLVGQRQIAYKYKKVVEEPLIPARGAVPGKIWGVRERREGKEEKLISGRGVVP